MKISCPGPNPGLSFGKAQYAVAILAWITAKRHGTQHSLACEGG